MCSSVRAADHLIPLRGREVFGVGDDGVAGLFEICNAFFAIGLGQRLCKNGWREDNGSAEQQNCSSHASFSSGSFSGGIVECEMTVVAR